MTEPSSGSGTVKPIRLRDIAEKINGYLKKFEADSRINKRASAKVTAADVLCVISVFAAIVCSMVFAILSIKAGFLPALLVPMGIFFAAVAYVTEDRHV